MAAIPAGIDTDRGPPMTVPLRHFVVGLGFLLAGVLSGATNGFATTGGSLPLVHVHLLLAGWVCVTIMGAMTQFVPVWSGTELHSRRIATVQLWLVAGGLVGFVGALVLGAAPWLGGAVVLCGFWLFVYNVARTLLGVRPWDVTERHFAVALGFFLLLSVLGLSLAVGFSRPVFTLANVPITHESARMAHVTVAVFGAVLTTVIGALYQLATMFTQSELRGIDVHIRRFEEIGYPVGVVSLAGGRLFGVPTAGRIGGALIVVSVLGIGVLLARRLYETRVEWTPMLRRYVVVSLAMIAWALLTAPAWIRAPLDPTTLYGAPGTVHLLAIGVIGFVVFGTLYHVVPFIVWIHRYSDHLGLRDVPMIDELYDGRVAAVEFGLLVAGTATIVAGDLLGTSTVVATGGRIAFAIGVSLFVANMLLVLVRHSPQTIVGILFDRVARSA